jgi:SM-20-related protein
LQAQGVRKIESLTGLWTTFVIDSLTLTFHWFVAIKTEIEHSSRMSAIPHAIIDDFLPDNVHNALLEHTLQVPDFSSGRTVLEGELAYRPDVRKGWLSNDRLGSHLPAFRSALFKHFDVICSSLGMKRFDLAKLEIRLAAHQDGDFFKPHRDTLIGKDRIPGANVRIITAVYYFHRQPKAFQGGVLQLHPVGDGPLLQIEPKNNRLAVFPSMLMHEVLPVTVPSGEFADSRFSVSCWFDRAAKSQLNN